MPHEIAVILDPEGYTTTLKEQGKISVFARESGNWNLSREKSFTLGDVQGVTDLRQKMEELITFLAQCKLIVGLRINGIPSVMLDQAQCKIWEREGKPIEFLDKILNEKEESSLNKHDTEFEDTLSPYFSEISPGNYTISVSEIQENHHAITTKQALLPFLRQGKFIMLEIICNHVPQWLEGEALALHMTIQCFRFQGNQVKVTLMKR